MTTHGPDVATPPFDLQPDTQRLWDAVAPTLARVGMLEPRYAYAFELLVASALGYFSLRAAFAADVIAGRLPEGDPDAESALGDWRRTVVRQCAAFGLMAESAEEAPDLVTVSAEERRLYRLFDVPDGWIPARIATRLPQGEHYR